MPPFPEPLTLDQVPGLLELLGDGSAAAAAWRGSRARLGVVRRASSLAPGDRYATVASFVGGWSLETRSA